MSFRGEFAVNLGVLGGGPLVRLGVFVIRVGEKIEFLDIPAVARGWHFNF